MLRSECCKDDIWKCVGRFLSTGNLFEVSSTLGYFSMIMYLNPLIFVSRCAFFQGQIEEPVRGLTSLLLHQDMPILVGINERGIYVIDNNDAVSARQS